MFQQRTFFINTINTSRREVFAFLSEHRLDTRGTEEEGFAIYSWVCPRDNHAHTKHYIFTQDMKCSGLHLLLHIAWYLTPWKDSQPSISSSNASGCPSDLLRNGNCITGTMFATFTMFISEHWRSSFDSPWTNSQGALALSTDLRQWDLWSSNYGSEVRHDCSVTVLAASKCFLLTDEVSLQLSSHPLPIFILML